MNLKIKLLLAIVLLFTALNIDARNEKISWKIQAGLNLSQISASEFKGYPSSDLRSAQVKPGFNIGLRFDYQFNNIFAIQTGLGYTMKGEKKVEYDEINKDEVDNEYSNFVITSGKIETKKTIHYFEIPLVVGIRYNINNKTQFQLNAGGYISIGIRGKYQTHEKKMIDNLLYENETYGWIFGSYGSKDNKSKNEKLPYSAIHQDMGCKRFDAGLKFETGFDIKNYYIGIAYDLGLVDMRSEKTKEMFAWGAMKNRNFSVNVGYSF